MSNISNISSPTPAATSANLDGIQFNNIQRIGFNSTKRYVLKDTPWDTLDTRTSLKPAVNAVDIDWNEAVIPYGNLETGDSVTINSTGELLSLISQLSEMQQEAHYTVDSIIQHGQENFYNDLLSNKKVYIENEPVFYYREIMENTDTVIYAYTYTHYMDVPYAIRYYIPIILSEEVVSDYIYNYFSPTVLIEVDTNSTTYSSIEIKTDADIITLPIDNYARGFLQNCDILAKMKGGSTYWRLDGKSTSRTAYINNYITRYMHLIDVNERYTVSITWDLNNKTLTTLATLINS